MAEATPTNLCSGDAQQPHATCARVFAKESRGSRAMGDREPVDRIAPLRCLSVSLACHTDFQAATSCVGGSCANAPSCLRLVRALAVETHENWLEANRYLNMDDLKEQKKPQLRQAA